VNYIIYDLEATCWQGKPRSKQQETIEIGAYMLNPYGELKSSYNRFIRPIVNPYLSTYCTELTTIEQEDVDGARTFNRVIREFMDWAEIEEEEYWLCSWGKFDQTLLIDDCQLHRVEDEWLDWHINLKAQYREIRGLSRERGFQWALGKEGLEFEGIPHRAIDDAGNLVKLFRKHIDEWRM
jgi:inhibitor of KinA sporulation pathway (predicted exonuclease)